MIADFEDLLTKPTRQNLKLARQTVTAAYNDPNGEILGFLLITKIKAKLHCLAGFQQKLPAQEFCDQYEQILNDSANIFSLQGRLNKIMNLIEKLIDNQ